MDRQPELRVVHGLGDSITVSTADGELLRYHYRTEAAASECPSPYFHPLRTLRGHVVTGHRPNDHRWHKGLAMTASHLSGQNFWGGGTYVHGSPGHGYLDLPNIGRQDHTGFGELTADADGAHFSETVDWTTADGDLWIAETRTVTVTEVDQDAGHWTLRFTTELCNVRGEALAFGSPTTEGRELAGYCGFFWRGPRSFTGGEVLAADGLEGGATVMGRTSPWLAFTGEFDEQDGHATLLFDADPANPGGPPHWFVRSKPFPAVNPSLAFYDELKLPADETLRLGYRLVVADGAWGREQIEKYYLDHVW